MFFSIYKHITIISITMQTQTKFVFALLKLILIFFSGQPNLPLTQKVGPLSSNEKLFLRLSAWNDKLLSTPKTITFLAMSLSKLHEPAPSNVIPKPLYTYFYLSHFVLH